MNAKKRWFQPIILTNISKSTLKQPLSQPSPQSQNAAKKPKRTLSSSDFGTCSKNQSPFPKLNLSSEDWLNSFAPKTTEDLAVHQKKIEEIEEWLTECDEYENSILLLTGPAGSGKTSTMRLVASNLGFDVNEWLTPVDVEWSGLIDNDPTFRENQLDKFKDFLFRASRYSSLFAEDSRKLIIVEDLPNIFFKDTTKFAEILKGFREYGKSLLVFIATDTKSKHLNFAHTLFPEHVRQEYDIQHLSFNAVSPTLLKKALKRICGLMIDGGYCKYFTPPANDIIENIVLTSQGDIRSAVMNLHLASLRHAPRLQLEQLEATSKTLKSRVGKEFKYRGLGSDENITLMHALGRVMNPKIAGDTKKLTHNPEGLTDSFLTQPSNFITLLHANYLPHFSKIENVSEAADVFCESDLFLAEYRADELSGLGLNLVIRGVMTLNENPFTGWMPIKGKYKHNAFDIKEEKKKLRINFPATRAEIALDYRSYARKIHKLTNM